MIELFVAPPGHLAQIELKIIGGGSFCRAKLLDDRLPFGLVGRTARCIVGGRNIGRRTGQRHSERENHPNEKTPAITAAGVHRPSAGGQHAETGFYGFLSGAGGGGAAGVADDAAGGVAEAAGAGETGGSAGGAAGKSGAAIFGKEAPDERPWVCW